MSDREIVSALKYVSRFREAFMLSELADYVTGKVSTGHIYDVAGPLLYDLGLKAQPQDGDYRIERLPEAARLVLTGEEKERQEAFFRAPGVPGKLERLIEAYVEKKTTGKQWDDPMVLGRIRKAVIAQKNAYWKEGKARKIHYATGYSVLGYLAYQFPVYFAQFEHILYGLAREGLLKRRMKVLDAGTGPGVVPLAIVDFLDRLDSGEAVIHSIEMYEENIEAYSELVPEYAAAKGRVKIEKPVKADLLDMPAIPDNLDLIVFSNVLNEVRAPLYKKADLVAGMAKNLAADGSLIIIEPADRENSMAMRELVRALLDQGLGIYSPCTFIWCLQCQAEACWSFDEKADVQPTRLMKKLADTEEPFRFTNTDIKFSYAILRKDQLTKEKYRVPPGAKFARMSKLKDHVGKRINVVASKMSGDLGDRKDHVFKVCDGTGASPVYAILPNYNIVPGNEALMSAGYGEVLEFRSILVRRNEEYGSYNLMIGKSTSVIPAGQPLPEEKHEAPEEPEHPSEPARPKGLKESGKKQVRPDAKAAKKR
jgi:hypothetical protein